MRIWIPFVILVLCISLNYLGIKVYAQQQNNIFTINPGATASNSQNPIEPRNITVPEGSTIIWLNKDSTPHLIASGTPDKGPSNIFYGDSFDTGKSYNVTLDKQGVYDYYDPTSTNIQGQITVIASPESNSLLSNNNNTLSNNNDNNLNNGTAITTNPTNPTSLPSSTDNSTANSLDSSNLIIFPSVNTIKNNGNNQTPQLGINSSALPSTTLNQSTQAAIPATNQLANESISKPTVFTSNSNLGNLNNIQSSTASENGTINPPLSEGQQLQQQPETFIQNQSLKNNENKFQIPPHGSIDSFKANGLINSTIVTSSTQWKANGEWKMIVDKGKMKNFTTTMSWFNGTSGHSHEFLNFVSKGKIELPSDNIRTINGKMNVGTNGAITWKGVPSILNIGGGGKTLTISLDHNKTDHHFAGQPILGSITSIIPCADKPGSSMEVLPTCT